MKNTTQQSKTVPTISTYYTTTTTTPATATTTITATGNTAAPTARATTATATATSGRQVQIAWLYGCGGEAATRAPTPSCMRWLGCSDMKGTLRDRSSMLGGRILL